MANRVAAAALQYSKWLSRFISWVWAIYRFSFLIAAALVPASAEALATTIGTLDTIMMINMGTYLCNSLGEKWLYSDRYILRAFDKGWFRTLFNKIKPFEQDEEGDEEDGDNQNG